VVQFQLRADLRCGHVFKVRVMRAEASECGRILCARCGEQLLVALAIELERRLLDAWSVSFVIILKPCQASGLAL
jgi:hypothetical protein